MEGGAQIVEFMHANMDLYDEEGDINYGGYKNQNGGANKKNTGNFTKAKVQHKKSLNEQKIA